MLYVVMCYGVGRDFSCYNSSPPSADRFSLRAFLRLVWQELQGIFGKAAAPRSAPPPPPPPPSAAADASKDVVKTKFVRRMPEHMLPDYIEANYRRVMTFVLTRAPKRTDFPMERLYNSESLDLLQRHH